MTPEMIVAELEALAAVGRDPDGYATMVELVEAGEKEGKSAHAVHRLVKAAIKAGRIHAMRVPRRTCVGDMQRIVAYRILPSEGA